MDTVEVLERSSSTDLDRLGAMESHSEFLASREVKFFNQYQLRGPRFATGG